MFEIVEGRIRRDMNKQESGKPRREDKEVQGHSLTKTSGTEEEEEEH